LEVLPEGFVDLPAAISVAQKQGIPMPLDSAKLMMAHPRGKPVVAVWILTPRRGAAGRVLSYFVAAADARRPLKLSDVTDYFNDYNEQWRYIADVFHSLNQSQSSIPQPAQNSIEGQPCLHFGLPFAPAKQGHWTWSPLTTSYYCEWR